MTLHSGVRYQAKIEGKQTKNAQKSLENRLTALKIA